METWQVRVVQECRDLNEKIGKLERFIDSKEFEKVSPEERYLLTEQLGVMCRYSKILHERIKKFFWSEEK